MVRAYECYAPDGNEVVGISMWDSPESRDRFRLSQVEPERREAMAPFLIKESSGFYVAPAGGAHFERTLLVLPTRYPGVAP
jgi:hypothetical protein